MRSGAEMKPVIISYDCIDHDPIDAWVPDEVHDVDFWMNFTIGYDERGGDNFQVRVVTPNNLHGPDADKYAIILSQYSWEEVLGHVTSILSQCHGSDWAEVSGKLAKHMYWEFDNYKPYGGA